MNDSDKLLTIELLKSMAFEFSAHFNGGSKYSRLTSVNKAWGLACCTETNGSPGYKVRHKTLYMTANHKVQLDMIKKPIRMAEFVEAYNAEIAKQHAE